jgi:hypothetical protein
MYGVGWTWWCVVCGDDRALEPLVDWTGADETTGPLIGHRLVSRRHFSARP